MADEYTVYSWVPVRTGVAEKLALPLLPPEGTAIARKFSSGRTDSAIASYSSSITGSQSDSADTGGVPPSGGAATGADAQSWSDSV